MEVANRFKGLDLVNTVHKKLWTEVCDIVQVALTKTIPKKKKCNKEKWLSEEALQIAEERREMKSKGERERYTELNSEFERIAKRDKMAFLNEKCNEIEKKQKRKDERSLQENWMHQRNISSKDVTIKGRNVKDLKEAEEIKKRWQEYTEELYKRRS